MIMVGIFLVMLFAAFNSACAEEHKSNSLKCMDTVGDYIFLISDTLDNPQGVCEFDQEMISKITKYRQKLANLEGSSLTECRRQWDKDWFEAWDMVRLEEEVPATLNNTERELLMRSSLDKAITHIAMSSGRFYQKRAKNSCNNIAANVSFHRTDNVAFLINHHIAKRVDNTQLDPSILRPLWFVVQHADLYPQLQDEWLKRFKVAEGTMGFPERLTNSLYKRLELARARRAAE